MNVIFIKSYEFNLFIFNNKNPLIYNKKFLTKAPIKFIKDYVNINIK